MAVSYAATTTLSTLWRRYPLMHPLLPATRSTRPHAKEVDALSSSLSLLSPATMVSSLVTGCMMQASVSE